MLAAPFQVDDEFLAPAEPRVLPGGGQWGKPLLEKVSGDTTLRR